MYGRMNYESAKLRTSGPLYVQTRSVALHFYSV
jgi:hypothetical protein